MSRTILIANIGVNWAVKGMDPIVRAKALVRGAAGAGADAICVPYMSAEHYYAEEKMVQQMEDYNMTPELFSAIFEEAVSLRLAVWASPFYYKDVRYLESKDVDGYHIVNGSLEYWPLLEAVKKTGKPVMLSTGHASFDEVDAALDALGEDQDITVLHSTGGLPTPARDSQIFRILDLIEEYMPLTIGYEAFTSREAQFMDILALTFGLDVLMRRIDLDDDMGVEREYSLTPNDFLELKTVIDEMKYVKNPDMYGSSGFTKSDYHAREKTFRCEKSDYLVPSKR